MIRIAKKEYEFADPGSAKPKAVCDIRGLSTDEKPTEDILTGSTFLEVDTGKIFLYDEESEDWNEWI